jgi:hypothetical protein
MALQGVTAVITGLLGGSLLQERGDGHRRDASVEVPEPLGDLGQVEADEPQLVCVVGTVGDDHFDL